MRIIALLLALLFALPASAHEVRPAYLELIEQRPSEWSIVWKQPVMGDRAVKLEPGLSNGWLSRKPASEELTPSHYTRRWQVRAPAAELAGVTVTIGGLERTITDVLVHARTAGGKSFDAVLHSDTPSVNLDFAGGEGMAVPAYLGLGVEHILAGADHLLFVLGLMMLVGFNWRLVWVVTSFTAGHSITLAASTLGFVRAPVATIEALVALSIVFVARELLRGDRTTLTARKPWMIALLFGLLHGFAFAGALAETGLPPEDIPLALLLFNLGVEAGQLVFVGAVLAAMLAWRKTVANRMPQSVELHFPRLAPYAMGCYAAFLLLERTVAAFA